MCTVSFISLKNKFIITSNRDEHTSRPLAFKPQEEIINNCKVVYPKDPKSGGTWFAVNENGVIAVLLNGAFQKHIPANNYSKSRGLVLLDIVSNPTPSFHFEKLYLTNIEPFTLLVFEHPRLIELRWDGKEKFRKDLDIHQNYIYSSATLYTEEIIQNREKLFSNYLSNHFNINEDTIFDFHSENNNDDENGFIINRNNKLKTFSITQAVFDLDEIKLRHNDLLTKENFAISILLNPLLNQLQ